MEAAGSFKMLVTIYQTTGVPELVDIAVTLLALVREVLGLNLGWDILTWFLWFYSVPPDKFRDSTSIRPRPLPPKSSSIHHSFVIKPFDAMQCNNSFVKQPTDDKIYDFTSQ
jgi:hypothetical protein